MRNIEEQVAVWLDGKHGKIGLILPDRKPTIDEWNELHQEIAEIMVRAIKKAPKGL